jgi:glutamate-1-semialdehyde 2,1-aminomutase
MTTSINATTEAKTCELLARYNGLTTRSKLLFERAKKIFPSGVTRRTVFFPPYPNYLLRGDGCYLYDVDNNRYIDFTNNYGVLILGHGNRMVADAVKAQFELGTVLGGPTEVEILLAERILQSFPYHESVLFCSSGTEANMVGLRAIRQLTGKSKIIMCEGSYHGSADPFVKLPAQTLGSCPVQAVRVPFNNITRLHEAIAAHKSELAAVFLEPIMRGIPAEPGYLEDVRRLTAEDGILLVFDEVVSGFRFTNGGLASLHGVVPDMTLLGKLIGGGFPIGAVVTSKQILKYYGSSSASRLVFDAPLLFHGGTYNAHPLAMAAGLATLQQLSPDVYAHLQKMGEEIRGGIEAAGKKTGIRIQTVGRGSIFQVYFTEKRVIDIASARTSNQYLHHFFDLSLVSKGIFPAKNHCSFVSSPMSSVEIQQFLVVAEATLNEMKEFLG